MFCVCKTEEKAVTIAARANALLKVLQRSKREVSSVSYSGGRYAAEVFARTAPAYFPETRPRYE